ncbi:hypothetical protein HGRIS_004863 [Hohenbuehelia grisea]|uniref:Peptidase C14 caspase domain-containing protein n=1 Tax=Hohenbuehelia grisea TaxID=104357 RepID=A0ABR3JDF4_9AGAR
MRPRSVLTAFVLSGVAVAAFAAAVTKYKKISAVEAFMTVWAARRRRTGPRKRALLIGINYETKHPRKGLEPLKVAQDDVKSMAKLLKEQYGYDDIRMMTDEEGAGDMKPTRANIERELKRFISDPQPGDHYYFHYSGHADQLPCFDGTEDDNLNEFIIPADCEGEDEDSYIPDDMLREYLVQPLPPGCSLVAVVDTCHSATMLDLPHIRCNATYFPWVSRGKTLSDIPWLTSPQTTLGSLRASSNDLIWLASPEAKKVIRKSSRDTTDVDGCILRQSSTSEILDQGGRVAIQSRSMSLKEQIIVEEEVGMEEEAEPTEPSAPPPSAADSVSDLPARTMSPEPFEPHPHEADTTTSPSLSPSSTMASIPNSPASRPAHLRPKRGVTLKVQIDLKNQDKCEFITTGVVCNSPAVMCSGFNCRPSSPTERPHVVCLSACKDWQASYEGPRGESMTTVLIGILKEDPQPQLKSLLERIGHRLHTSALNRHTEFQKYNEWVDKQPKKRGRRMDTSCFMDPQVCAVVLRAVRFTLF